MVVAVDTSNHWKYITGRETVTYYVRGPMGLASAGAAVPNAKRSPLSKALILADAILAKDGLKWTVWVNQLSGIVPKFGDVLEDQYGARWIVQRIDVESLGQRFDLTCVISQK